MADYGTTTVTPRALVLRINRRLAHHAQRLCKSRCRLAYERLGPYYLVDLRFNIVIEPPLSIESLVREIGVLHEGEVVAS